MAVSREKINFLLYVKFSIFFNIEYKYLICKKWYEYFSFMNEYFLFIWLQFLNMWLWTRVFPMYPHSTVKLAFHLVKIWFFLLFFLKLRVITYFSFFLRKNKIRKKTLCDSLFEKNMFVKIKSKFEVRLPIGKVRWWAITSLY